LAFWILAHAKLTSLKIQRRKKRFGFLDFGTRRTHQLKKYRREKGDIGGVGVGHIPMPNPKSQKRYFFKKTRSSQPNMGVFLSLIESLALLSYAIMI
jgi:hypothetical protein